MWMILIHLVSGDDWRNWRLDDPELESDETAEDGGKEQEAFEKLGTGESHVCGTCKGGGQGMAAGEGR